MANSKGYMSLLGFVIFFLGVLSLILSLVGLKLKFLAFLDAFGGTLGLLFKLIMTFAGIIILYLSKMDRSVD